MNKTKNWQSHFETLEFGSRLADAVAKGMARGDSSSFKHYLLVSG
jgi:hypothetical protein